MAKVILSGLVSFALLFPITRCKSPAGPNGETKTYIITINNKDILTEADIGGNTQLNGIWMPSGSSWEIESDTNGVATIQSIHVDAPNYNPSYIVGVSGGQVVYTKDRDGAHSFAVNKNTTIDAKLISNDIDTKEFARMIGEAFDYPNEIGNGVVIRFDNSKTVRDVGIVKAIYDGQDPTPRLMQYLEECVGLVNECNGQQLTYIGEISTNYVDEGVTHVVRDGIVEGILILNEAEGKITRSGFYTPDDIHKVDILEELFQVSTGIFWDNGSPNSTLIWPGSYPYENTSIMPRGKTYANLIKRLPRLFKLSIDQPSPSISTQSYVSPTTRAWGTPKDYQSLTNPTSPEIPPRSHQKENEGEKLPVKQKR